MFQSPMDHGLKQLWITPGRLRFFAVSLLGIHSGKRSGNFHQLGVLPSLSEWRSIEARSR